MSRDGLTLCDVQISKAGVPLFALDTHVGSGEVLTVMGPSGIGKSTLLSFIIGMLPTAFNASGQVLLNGQDITDFCPEARKVGILFQDDLLFPHLSVGENLAFGLAPGIKDRAARIDAALVEVGLKGFASRDPATLSGGQKTRVALMRMLLSQPNALVLDEPFARLDATRRGQVRSLVFGIAKRRNLPVLMVTHDLEDARAAQGRIIDLTAPPGTKP